MMRNLHILPNEVIIITYLEKRKRSLAIESWKALWFYIECMSAEVDNKAAVSSLFTEIKSDVTADDTQYNLVRFLAKRKNVVLALL